MRSSERMHIVKCSSHGFYVKFRASDPCLCCEQGGQARRAADLHAVGVPKPYSQKTLDNFFPATQLQRDALGFVRMYAENFAVVQEDGSNLVIRGPRGAGKTHLAVGILAHVLRAGYGGRYLDARTRPTGRDAAADLLVIDHFTTRPQAMRLGGILYRRSHANLPTILLTRLDAEIFTLTLGTSYTDLMRQNGIKCLNCDWEPAKI